jgi:hypothetical protein
MVHRFRLVGLVVVVALACLGSSSGLLASPAQAQNEAPPPMFVGQVDDTDAFIGIVTGPDGLVAYVCDGTANSLADLFRGSTTDANGGVLTLPAASGNTLAVNVDADSLPAMVASGGSLTGALVTSDGARHAFSAPPAGAVAQLMRTEQTLDDGTSSEGGWIVLDDGQIRGSITQSKGGAALTTGMSTGPGGSAVQVQTFSATIDMSSPDFVAPMSMVAAHNLAHDLQLKPLPVTFDLGLSNGASTPTTLEIPRV